MNNSSKNLEEVFDTFNQVSTQLDETYKDLESSVQQLSSELGENHSERMIELKEKEELADKLSSLLKALPLGIVVLDKDKIVIDENSVAKKLTGSSLKNKMWTNAFPELIDDNSENSHDEFTFKNGRRVSISSNSFGKNDEAMIVLHDRTSNYQLQKEINNSQNISSMSEVAARFAQKVKAPLDSAMFFLSHMPAQTTSSRIPIGKKVIDQLKDIEETTENLLTFTNTHKDENSVILLNELLEEVESLFTSKYIYLKGKIHLHLIDEACWVKGNRNALIKAFSKLIENSIQACDTTPKITITLIKQGRSSIIKVKDNGHGIDTTDLNNIYEPFFTTRKASPGLGLSIVSSIINIHQGIIKLSNTSINGSEFTVTLPESQEEISEGLWQVSDKVQQGALYASY